MSTKFLSPGWRMPRNANQSKQSNYSMDFSGSGQYIDLGNSTQVQPVKEMSISAWINASSLATYRGIVSCMYNGASYDGFALRLDDTSSNKIQFVINSTTQIKSTSTITTGQWYHLVATYDGANIKLYFNGSLESSTSLTGNIDYSDGSRTTNIGSLYSVGANEFEFTGQINQVSIFDYALSASQVTTLWGGGTATSNPMALPSSPIAYYPLGTSAWDGNFLAENNAIGDYVFDFSVSGNGYITVADSATLEPQNLTVSFWINAGAQSNYEYYLEKGNFSYAVYTGATTTDLLFFIYDGSSHYVSNALTNVLDSNWHHIAFTFDGSQIIGYKDGVPNTPVSASATILYDTNPLRLFSRGTASPSAHPSGKMSNAQIFNIALSGSEIETLYNYGSPIRTLANIPQNSNLKAWYKLDASEIYNSSSTEWSVDNNQNPSAYQSSLDFVSSESDYITVSNSTALSSYSISCWVNARTLSSYGRLVSLDSVNHRFLGLHSDGTLISGYASPGWNQLFTTSTINTDTWNHIVLVDNGTNTKIYVNTVENTLSNSIAVDGPNYYIGSYGGSQNFFDGKLSNVSIWNTALTSAQITEIYNNGTPSSLSSHSATSNLVSWYKLNNTTTGIQDSKGSNNGTNNGATEYPGFVNVLAGESSGMSQTNLVQSDLQTVAPYSKYAMNFDASSNNFINCGNDSSLEITGNFTISTWINITSDGYYPRLIGKSNSGNTRCNYGIGFYNYKPSVIANYNGTWYADYTSTALSTGVWYNVVGIYDGSNFLLYVNGALDKTTSVSGFNIATAASETSGDNLLIAEAPSVSDNFDGKISNVSIWNTNLTSTQVREIYNEGLPKDLNSHSAYSNLISWWQLGENSSFATNWICADEKGSNNGDGQNMGVDALTNGVGTTANGTSTGMAVGALVGDAPYSTANAVSSGMSVVSRVSGVSDATITTGGTGYSTGTNIATTGGSGTNCTINITTVSGGAITAITINSGGNNYLIGDVLTVSGGNGNATITVSGLNTP